ncbi:MAG: DUF4173 domain-containing protein [Chloroflexi bacterium]|nr:DUF4173 domain-containing protein [Chloroflexota bacterium]
MQAANSIPTAAAAQPAETAPQWLPQAGLRLSGVVLLLGIAADVLFYKREWGLSVPLFVALLVGTMAYLFARAGEARFVRRNLWVAAPLLFFAFMVFVRDEPALTALNVLACLLLLGVLYFTLGTNPLERLTVAAYPLAVLIGSLTAPFSTFPLVGWLLARTGEHSGRGQVAIRVLVGLLLALPLVIVFGALFASADAIFAQTVRDIVRLDSLPDLFWQAVWIGFVMWICGGALVMALNRAHQAKPSPDLEKPLAAPLTLGVIEGGTVLAAVNALFVVFVGIQFTYLFGGNANIHVDGFTYAEYARRGFFELVAVAILTMGLLLGLDWLTKRASPAAARAFKALCLLLIALVLIVLVSATLRMSLYESAYGYTSLRLYTHWFMLWMGAVFVLKVVEIVADRRQVFAFGGFISLIVSLMGFNLLNPDATIAQLNVQRYFETGKLDTAYAAGMSADAAPVFMASFDEVQGVDRTALGGAMHLQMDTLYRRLENASWPSYHWGRKQAIDALLAQRERLLEYEAVYPLRRN